jgi:hypothetical protein
MIADLEGDRGFYAGVVSIRCAVLSADRRTADSALEAA